MTKIKCNRQGLEIKDQKQIIMSMRYSPVTNLIKRSKNYTLRNQIEDTKTVATQESQMKDELMELITYLL